MVRLSKFGNFLEISGLFKTRKNSSEISSEIILEIISCFWVKKSCFGVKNRSFGVKNRGFQTIRIYGKLGICSIPNFTKLQKMMLKLNFGNREKLVPTWIPTQIPTRTFEFKFRMQGLTVKYLQVYYVNWDQIKKL